MDSYFYAMSQFQGAAITHNKGTRELNTQKSKTSLKTNVPEGAGDILGISRPITDKGLEMNDARCLEFLWTAQLPTTVNHPPSKLAGDFKAITNHFPVTTLGFLPRKLPSSTFLLTFVHFSFCCSFPTLVSLFYLFCPLSLLKFFFHGPGVRVVLHDNAFNSFF